MNQWVEVGEIYRGERDRILPYNKELLSKDRSGSKRKYRGERVLAKNKTARRTRARNRKKS